MSNFILIPIQAAITLNSVICSKKYLNKEQYDLLTNLEFDESYIYIDLNLDKQITVDFKINDKVFKLVPSTQVDSIMLYSSNCTMCTIGNPYEFRNDQVFQNKTHPHLEPRAIFYSNQFKMQNVSMYGVGVRDSLSVEFEDDT